MQVSKVYFYCKAFISAAEQLHALIPFVEYGLLHSRTKMGGDCAAPNPLPMKACSGRRR
jgi:hypothetical protein